MSRAWIGLVLVATAACGKTGPLRPPAPRGPLPPSGVEARQLGSSVEIAFTLPGPRGTSKSQALGRVEILRVAYPRGITPPDDPDAFRLRGEVVAELDPARAGEQKRLAVQDGGLGSLADGGLGWTLRYGVRVRDVKGRSSPLVAAHALALVEPRPPPAGLRAEATADGIRLEWDAAAGVDDPEYNVYRGAAGAPLGERPLNVQPLDAEDYLDTSAAVGERYRYVVRTVVATGTPYRESASPTPVEVEAVDRFAPASPTGLVAVQEGPAVRLLWNPGAERDLEGYRVYRLRGEGDWAPIGTEVVRQPSLLDPDVQPGERLLYRVTAVDRALPPNESAPSEVAEILVGGEP